MSQKRIMLVEGKEDLHVVASLFRYFGHDRFYHIEEQEGIDNLKTNLPTYLKASDLQSLAIVIDADDDVAGRWQSIRTILVASGYQSVPSAPAPTGTVLTETGKPAAGIWLMPDNSTQGMLERFASFLIPSGDTLWPRAQAAISDIPTGERRFALGASAKAEIHTWLAWQEAPGLSIGTAITLRYLDAALPHARDFWNWADKLADAGRP